MNVRAVTLAAFIGGAAASPVLAQNGSSAALVDYDVTVGAGASIVTTLGAAATRVSDAVVPHRLFRDRDPIRRSANITYRLLKLAFVDAPQEQLLLVVNHEIFGHGARVRERFDGPIGYSIGVPPPYGRGGASTSFVFDRPPSVHERLAIHAAGMEASGVAAALVARRAFLQRRLHARDALRYLAFELDTLTYILTTDDHAAEPEGHDVAAFLDTYNELAATTARPAVTVRTLRRQALVGLANPMVGYAVFAIARYAWNGVTDSGVPALSGAGFRYLPIVRYRLTPFGAEWSLVNEIEARTRPAQIELRTGRLPPYRTWGIGIRTEELKSWRGWNVGAGVDLWRQPEFARSGASVLTTTTNRVGVRLRVRAARPLIPVWFSPRLASVVVDAGLKTSGFVAGDPLDRGISLRVGAGLPLSR